ncbi:MAG: MBL fold metallo-hydrolase [Lachnospiraceae bacterium]|nr:MBL fold metallo-hydrolase [Lachnospiraceae bacterium]
MTENVEVFEQNSIRISARIGNIYIDPFQIREEPKDAAYILITHDHYDHFSPDDIAKVVGPHTILVVPEKMEGKAQEVARLMSKIVTVTPGVYKEIDGLEFETVAAYNTLKPFHRKDAGWVGYILRIDGKRIYVAGDTDATKEARGVKCDIALVPIGGTFTMDARKAADLVNEIRPSVAIPVHYGAVVGSSKDGDVFAANVKEPIKVEFKIQF